MKCQVKIMIAIEIKPKFRTPIRLAPLSRHITSENAHDKGTPEFFYYLSNLNYYIFYDTFCTENSD